MALAPIMEAFTWGSAGQKLTPEQIAREREIAALLGQVDTSPVGDWTQGAARMANSFVGNLREGRANRAEQDNATYNQDIVQSLLGSMGGGVTGGYAGGNPVASALAGGSLGGVTAPMDPASARVAQAHGVPQGERASYIRNGLLQRGLPEHVADAFLVNFQDESGLDPNINEITPLIPGSRGGFGLYQLTGPRRREYEAFASQRGVNPGDIDAQLDFMMGELQGSESRAAQSILGAPDTATAAQAIVSDFLRPAPEHRQSRMSRYSRLGGGGTPAQAALESLAVGGSMPMPDVASSLMQPQQAQQQPVQMAQAGGINPAIIQALSDPRASGGTQQIAQLLLGQQFSQQQAEQERMRAEQEAQIQMQQRMQAAQAAGVDPRFIGDDEIWKQATGAQFREQPTDIREYEYARNQGYDGSFAQFQQEQKRAGATNVTTNVGEGDKFYQTLDTKNAETFSTLSEAGVAARSKAGQIDRLDELLTRAPQGAAAMLKQAAGEYGINTEGLSDIQAAQALINELVPQQRTPGSGPMSDADLALYKASLPRLINQPEGNKLIVETMRNIANYQVQMGDIADLVADREISPAEARKMIRELSNPLEGFGQRASQFEAPAARDKPITEMTDEELEALANGNS